MAIYYVPAIWKNGADVITNLVLKRLLDDNTLAVGQHYSTAQAIQLIDNGHELYTAKYMYNRRWQRRAKIHVVNEGGLRYLRSNHDNTESDNLDNMIPMHSLGC